MQEQLYDNPQRCSRVAQAYLELLDGSLDLILRPGLGSDFSGHCTDHVRRGTTSSFYANMRAFGNNDAIAPPTASRFTKVRY